MAASLRRDVRLLRLVFFSAHNFTCIPSKLMYTDVEMCQSSPESRTKFALPLQIYANTDYVEVHRRAFSRRLIE